MRLVANGKQQLLEFSSRSYENAELKSGDKVSFVISGGKIYNCSNTTIDRIFEFRGDTHRKYLAIMAIVIVLSVFLLTKFILVR